ncbi:MAG: hypothetical protein Q4F95_00475 [Oscillospiraceae bacterium]|nr:hypothetical protein [Oscillospiraceae bacterium]
MKKQTKKIVSSLMAVSMLLSAGAFAPSSVAQQLFSTTSISAATSAPKTGLWKVAADGLAIRNKATTRNSKRLGLIYGRPYIGISSVVWNGTEWWGKTTYNGITGYVCLSYCEFYHR